LPTATAPVCFANGKDRHLVTDAYCDEFFTKATTLTQLNAVILYWDGRKETDRTTTNCGKSETMLSWLDEQSCAV
jgi:hypothetical protein